MTFQHSRQFRGPFRVGSGNHWSRIPERDRRELELLRRQMHAEIGNLLNVTTKETPEHRSTQIEYLRTLTLEARKSRQLLGRYSQLAEVNN